MRPLTELLHWRIASGDAGAKVGFDISIGGDRHSALRQSAMSRVSSAVRRAAGRRVKLPRQEGEPIVRRQLF
jgi:hypothetical protein